MGTWQSAAALNNAEWCDTVVRSHGGITHFGSDAWASEHRTPAYYPDAVTLAPRLVVPELLSSIDTSVGCSVKDSFTALDLTPYGFGVLFEADWIVRVGPPPPPTSGGPECLVNIPNGSLIYSVFGLVIFAGLTVVDFQRLRTSSDMASAPLIAASIFLDALNVFFFFLRIFARRD